MTVHTQAPETFRFSEVQQAARERATMWATGLIGAGAIVVSLVAAGTMPLWG